MGSYDSVWFRCPVCTQRLELQSKSGSCNFQNYELWDVPPRISADLDRQEILCSCDAKIVLVQLTGKIILPMLTAAPPNEFGDLQEDEED